MDSVVLYTSFNSAVGALNTVSENKGLRQAIAEALAQPVTMGETLARWIVVEGLDGVGKSTVCTAIRDHFGDHARLFTTPPDDLVILRPHFDGTPEHQRRAYYTLGNYLVAGRIRAWLAADPSRVAVCDRHFLSTAAYALARLDVDGRVDEAERLACGGWPQDLPSPGTVFLLTLDEKTRTERLYARQGGAQNLSGEEKLMERNRALSTAVSAQYARLCQASEKRFQTVSVDASQEKAKVLECVLKMCVKQ